MKIIKPIVFSFLLLMSALSFSATTATMGPYYTCFAKQYTCVKGSSGHSCVWKQNTRWTKRSTHLCTTCSYSTVVAPCKKSWGGLGNAGWAYHCNARTILYCQGLSRKTCEWSSGKYSADKACHTCGIRRARYQCK